MRWPRPDDLVQSLPRPRPDDAVGRQTAALLELRHRGGGRYVKVPVIRHREPLGGEDRLQGRDVFAIITKPNGRPLCCSDGTSPVRGKCRLCPLEISAALDEAIEAAVDPTGDFLNVVLVRVGIELVLSPKFASDLERSHRLAREVRVADQVKLQQFSILLIVGAASELDQPSPLIAHAITRMRIAEIAAALVRFPLAYSTVVQKRSDS